MRDGGSPTEDQGPAAASPGPALQPGPALESSAALGPAPDAAPDPFEIPESVPADSALDPFVDPKHIGLHHDGVVALLIRVRVPDQPGVLHALTRVIFEHRANITYVDISERRAQGIATYFELSDVEDLDGLVAGLEALPIVRVVEREPSFGQVVLGAVTEADRHNIRGERISVDTIPLVGEEDLAGAVRAVARLPRAVALVMAGSIMGGEVALAVREVRRQGILVVSLNMAGSVPDEADLVVTDPVQAGVMTVMAVARTAKFDIRRQRGRHY
jgi:energy-converting hydrogenase B subunit Q